jgi:hypothetical protein
MDQVKQLSAKSEELLNSIYRLVAEICVDKALDYEFWAKGSGFSQDVPLQLLNEAINRSQRLEVDTANFRRK